MITLLPRFKFGKWAKLEIYRANVVDATDRGSAVDVARNIHEYLSVAFSFFSYVSKYLPWDVTVRIYSYVANLNIPRTLPMFQSDGRQIKDAPWEYNGRSYYFLIHTLASRYGWTVQYIDKLDVDAALSLLQEVFVSAQLEDEFSYSLSENAYVYNSTTKASSFKPLRRPVWMLPKAEPIKKVAIPISMMPKGAGDDALDMLRRMYEAKQASEKAKS